MKFNISHYIYKWGIFAAAVIASIACFAPFRLGESLISYYCDDFYYYAVVARNFANTGASTFDGTTLTNGYHPLWFLVLSFLLKFTTGRAFLFCVSLLTVLGCVITYWLSRSILNLRCYHHPLTVLASLWVSCFYLHVARNGMEVILAVPFALALLRYWMGNSFRFTPRQCLWSSLLISAVILSRLDTALLIAGMATIYLLFGEERFSARLRHLALIAVGCMPVYIYLIVNKLVFGMFTPVSGAAKQLRFSHEPDWDVLMSLFIPTGKGTIVFVAVSVLLLLISCILIFGGVISSLKSNQKIVLVSFIYFPFIYYPLLCCLSHYWYPPWYGYPLMTGGLASLFVVHMFAEQRGWLASPVTRVLGVAGCILFSIAFLIGLGKPPQQTTIYLAAVEIRNFARTHPGNYAMGDRSGIVAYMLTDSVFQLEGLVEDKKYLEDMRRSRNLNEELREHNIHYYVATNNVTQSGDCVVTVEPFQPGSGSPQLHGRFCSKPIAYFPMDGTPPVYIFDLNREPAR